MNIFFYQKIIENPQTVVKDFDQAEQNMLRWFKRMSFQRLKKRPKMESNWKLPTCSH